MKIQCNVCEMAEATVLCCADEAALCWACDENIHAANKLASKHQRVPLSGSSSQMPRCDICQEASGYIFCLEDRALLCRKCDVAIHTANAYVTGHQRFLLTGVKVALEPTDPVPCSSIANSHSREISTKTKVRPPSDKEFSMPSSGELSRSLSVQGGSDDFMTNRTLLTGDSASGGFSQWQIDELINLTGFNQNYGFMDNGSSKADSGKLGDSDSSPSLRAADVELDDDDECPGHIPEASWTVPQVPSPPTASGLYWPRSYHNSMDSAVFVPDICASERSRNGMFSKEAVLDV
ncbi:B-box zinc finger protein 22-like isoform X1 [Cucurbita moschata]|uniref:B-box zinc finger protein 22-like isoform X1 n=1 Tax=Cucurbita moschata TaxID=3662 RepID=A0A6J1FSQ2_CUCMO|nr:B-box zinc finger protein 22-like isoform X1 [Cucurbita moschata]